MSKKIVELDKNDLNELENFIKKRVERIVFNTRRSRPKIKGGNVIENDTGNLRRRIKSANNFIKQTKGGLSIDFPVPDYYRYLDDERRDELNWYLTEAIFEDKEFRDKIRDLYRQTAQRAVVNILKDI